MKFSTEGFETFWVNTENYGSHCMETLMNLHEYPSISMNVHVDWSWRCSFSIWRSEKFPGQSTQHSKGTQRGGADMQASFKGRMDGWLLSLWGSCEAVSLEKNIHKSREHALVGLVGCLQGLVLSRPLSATSRPLSATSRTAELRTLGAELKNSVKWSLVIQSWRIEFNELNCSVEFFRVLKLIIFRISHFGWRILPTFVPDDSASSANLPGHLWVPGEELEKNQWQLIKSSAVLCLVER